MQNLCQATSTGTRNEENCDPSSPNSANNGTSVGLTLLQKNKFLASFPVLDLPTPTKYVVSLPALSDEDESDVDSIISEPVDSNFVETASKLFGQASGQPVDPETLEALLEAAGIGKSAPFNGKQLFDGPVKSGCSALDEAEAELAQMKEEAATTAAASQLNIGGSLQMGSADPTEQMMAGRLIDDGKVLQDTEESESLLSLACSGGYYELAQVLLKINANVEDRGSKRDCTPLMEAASAGHIDIVNLLLEHGAEVNAQSSAGNTPLMYACSGGHEEIVKILLNHGANIEDHNENGHTPLMEAASSGHVGIAKILLEQGAGINTHSTEFKESALTLACYKGHLEMVKFLLDAGADHEHKTDEMHTALMEASMDGHVEVARLLLDHGAQVNMPTDSFESPLTLAACGGHAKLASLLLERGANIEEVNDEGYTPLMEAAREGHEEMVALLLAQGADINAQTDETQETALTLACCGGFLEVAKFLIEVEADIELGCSTPLMEAAQEGQGELVKFLLSKEANVHAITATGDTALTYACENGHTDVVSYLLAAGANLEHLSEGGRTPLMKAARAGHFCTVRFLISKGADVNRATTMYDHTVLSLACAGGHLPVVELLLAHGADPSHKLKDNSTCLIEASKGGHSGVMARILGYPRNIVTAADGTTTPPAPEHGEIPRVPLIPNMVPPQEPDKHPGELQPVDYQVTHMQDNATDPMDLIQDDSYYQQEMEMDPTVPTDMMAGFPSDLIEQTSKSNSRPSKTFKSAEEQILEKQQIIAELQKVERELQQRMEIQQAQSKMLARRKEELASKSLHEVGTDLPENAKVDAALTLSLVAAGSETNNNKESPESPTCSNLDNLADLSLDEREIKLLNGASPPIPHDFEIPSYLDDNGQIPEGVDLSLSSGRDMVAGGGLTDPCNIAEMDRRLQGQDGQELVETKDHGSSTHLPDVEHFIKSWIPEREGDNPNGERPITEGQEDIGALQDELRQQVPLSPNDLRTPIPLPGEIMDEFKKELETQTTVQRKSFPQTQSVGTQCGGSPLVGNVNQSMSPGASMTPPYASTPSTPREFEVPSFTPHPPVEVDAQTESNHDTALTIACAGGFDDLAQMLLEKEANVEHRDKKGFTPLLLAATAGHYKTVKILLHHGAEIEAQSERTKDTPLSLACSSGKYEVVELLLKHGANKEHRNVSDYTPLSLAASGGFVNIIKLLLKSGAEINSRTGSKLGISPLMLAAMNGHTPAVKLLLDNGSDINAQIETNRNTALTLACFQGRTEVVSLLVDRKANVEHRAKTGLTPLMEAASGGYAEVGSVLINKGADVNAPPVPSSRDTALTIAADKGHYKFVELLLHHKAAVDVKNKKGQSSLWLACNGGHLDVVQLLVKEGADIDSQDNRKMSCLMAAFRKGHVKVVRWMVKHVNQFPSDAECIRYIATINDKDLHKKCNSCFEIIVVAKDRQAAEANKNANSLLEELETEKTREETRKAAAAKRREKKRKKRKEKQQKTSSSNNSPEPMKEEEEEEEEEDSLPSSTAESLEERVPLDPPSATTTTTIGVVRTTDTIRISGAKKMKLQGITSTASSATTTATTSVINVTMTPLIISKVAPICYENGSIGGKEKGAEDEKRNEKRQKIRESKEKKKKASKMELLERRGEDNSARGKAKKKKIMKDGKPINHSLRDEYHGLSPIDGSKKSPASTDPCHSLAIPPYSSASPKRGQRREEGWKEVVRRSKKVTIPSSSVSRVIGRSGGNINAIRDMTGAHIDVERQNNKGGERNINIKGSAEATRQAHQLITSLIKEPDKEIGELMAKLKKNNTAAQSITAASISLNHVQGTNGQSQKVVVVTSSVGPRFKNTNSTSSVQSLNILSKPLPSQATISQFLPRNLAVSNPPPRATANIMIPPPNIHPRMFGANMRWGAPQVKIPASSQPPPPPVVPTQQEINTYQAPPVQTKSPPAQVKVSPVPPAQSYQQPPTTTQDVGITPSKNVVRRLFKPQTVVEGGPTMQPVTVATPVSETAAFHGSQSSSLFSNHVSSDNMMPGAMDNPPPAMQGQGLPYATAPLGPLSKPVTIESSQAFVPENTTNLAKVVMATNTGISTQQQCPMSTNNGMSTQQQSPMSTNNGILPQQSPMSLIPQLNQQKTDPWSTTIGQHTSDEQVEIMHNHQVPTRTEESKAPGYNRLSTPIGAQMAQRNKLLASTHNYGGPGSAPGQGSQPMFHPPGQHQRYANLIPPYDGSSLNPPQFVHQLPEMHFAPIPPENHTPTPPPNGPPVSPGVSPRSEAASPSQEKKVMRPIGIERHKQYQHRKTPTPGGFSSSMGGDFVQRLGSGGGSSIWSYQGNEVSGSSGWYGGHNGEDTSNQIVPNNIIMQNQLQLEEQTNGGIFTGRHLPMVQMNPYNPPEMMDPHLNNLPPPSPMTAVFQPRPGMHGPGQHGPCLPGPGQPCPVQPGPGLPVDSNGLWNPQLHPGQNDNPLDWLSWGQQTM